MALHDASRLVQRRRWVRTVRRPVPSPAAPLAHRFQRHIPHALSREVTHLAALVTRLRGTAGRRDRSRRADERCDDTRRASRHSGARGPTEGKVAGRRVMWVRCSVVQAATRVGGSRKALAVSYSLPMAPKPHLTSTPLLS